MPERVQRSRARGRKLPENTVYVGRPGKYGNPHPFTGGGIDARTSAVEQYREDLHAGRLPFTIEEAVNDLRGKNLACW